MDLDYSTYRKTRELVEADFKKYDAGDEDAKAYTLFTGHGLSSMDDFWKLVAFAYSWMPTIPTLHYSNLKAEDEAILVDTLNKLTASIEDLTWAFETLVPVINRSYVVVSKVLHFIKPTVIPIYDSRTIGAWQRLFAGKKKHIDKPLDLRHQKGELKKVLFYITKMHEWLYICQIEEPNLTLRHLELTLYYFDKVS